MQEITRCTLFIADRKINDMMKACDMCANHKAFITKKEKVSFKTTSLVNKEYFMKMIKKSKSQKNFWIPAIQHEDILYVSPEIMELSDGNKIAFVGEAA